MRSISPRKIRKQDQKNLERQKASVRARNFEQAKAESLRPRGRSPFKAIDEQLVEFKRQRDEKAFIVMHYFEVDEECYQLVLYTRHGDRSEVIDEAGNLRMLFTSSGEVLDAELKTIGSIHRASSYPFGLSGRGDQLKFDPILPDFPVVIETNADRHDAYFRLEERVFREYIAYLA